MIIVLLLIIGVGAAWKWKPNLLRPFAWAFRIVGWMMVVFSVIATLSSSQTTLGDSILVIGLGVMLVWAGKSLKLNAQAKGHAIYTAQNDRIAERASELKPIQARVRHLAPNVLAAINNNDVFGTVGGDLEDAGFGAKGEQGLIGDAVLARTLERLMPVGAKLFHSLRWPGATNTNADIDHAVVASDTIVLFDAKRWSPGQYWSLPEGHVFRQAPGDAESERFAAAETIAMLGALKAMDRELPHMTVKVAIVVIPSSPGEIDVSHLDTPDPRIQYFVLGDLDERFLSLSGALPGKPANMKAADACRRLVKSPHDRVRQP